MNIKFFRLTKGHDMKGHIHGNDVLKIEKFFSLRFLKSFTY